MTEDAPNPEPHRTVLAKSPEPPMRNDTASRVQVALMYGGLLIALVNGALLPTVAIFIPSTPPPFLPALALAAAMMGVGKAVKITRARRDGGDDS